MTEATSPLPPSAEQLTEHLRRQRAAFYAEGLASAAVRRDRLRRVIEILKRDVDAICHAADSDFGGRHRVTTLSMDIQAAVAALKHAESNVAGWMRPDRRPSVPLFNLFGARAELQYQPKGVVGIVGTWNAPLFTVLAPLASVFAAGNRAMLKPSDQSPNMAQWLQAAVARSFEPLELSVVVGDVSVAQAFSRLPFDHLVFTGGHAVGRAIMHSAAENLTPLTLELGGKCPVIIGRDADLKHAAERIAVGRSQNGGQICVTPDTVYVPGAGLEPFLAAFRECWAGMFPAPPQNLDVTSIASPRQLARIDEWLAEARTAGTRIETLGPVDANGASRRRPLHLVIAPPVDSGIARHEIFGHAMIVAPYDHLDQVIAAIQNGSTPLALYYFGRDRAECTRVLEHTRSGGVAINDVLMHVALTAVPFGGAGGSGMGVYQGREGFQQYSDLRGVYRAGWWDPRRALGMLPPYSAKFAQLLERAIRRA
ncbi:MAG: aldehyde dehydrogenase family protein [Acidobacteria bacterium]|nr:aldehyde dehydrogenase family protein [Acidobacteriota bacterium]